MTPKDSESEAAAAPSVRVDFYVLADTHASARLQFACRLAEKAHHLEQQVHLHTASAAEAEQLDNLLWTFRQGSFVPHEILAGGSAVQSPVTVGHGAAAPPRADLLINLAADIPDFAAACSRVVEIVDGSENIRQQGREHFRRYRERGWNPASHTIGDPA